VSHVAVIACDHGLGHVRRCLLVSDELRTRGHDVTLLAPAGAVDRLRAAAPETAPQTADRAPLHVVDFATATTPAGLRAGDAATVRWQRRLPPLDRFDRVVGDTLPEVLEIRPDAVLLAQFLWHDVLEGVDRDYRERASAFARTATLVVGSGPFAMPAVRDLPGFRAVGLYAGPADTTVRAVRHDATALLIAGGATDALRAPLGALVADLAGSAHDTHDAPDAPDAPGGWSRVHVDRELLPSGPPAWMTAATHTSEMYDEVGAAVVRPGLGTLTELLVRRARIACVREEGNAELAHNAAAVVRLGRGADLGAAGGLTWRAVAAALAAPPTGPPPGSGPGPDGVRQAVDLILAHPGGG